MQTDVCVCVIPLCGTLFCFVLFLSPAYRSVGSTEVSITYILFMYSTKHKHTLLLALHRLRWSLSSSEFTIGTALLSPLALRRPFYHNHSIRIFVVPTCHSTLWCVCRDVAERIPHCITCCLFLLSWLTLTIALVKRLTMTIALGKVIFIERRKVNNSSRKKSS